MLKTYLLLLMMMTMSIRCFLVRRNTRSVMTDGGSANAECIGILKIFTPTKTHILKETADRLNIKDVLQVMVEGSCCGRIYLKKNFRGRHKSWNRAGLVESKLRRVKSIRIEQCKAQKRKEKKKTRRILGKQDQEELKTEVGLVVYLNLFYNKR